MKHEELNGINTQQLEARKSIIPELGERQKEVLNALIELGGNANVEMIAEKIGRPNYVVSPRVTELLRKKLIRDTGMVILSNKTLRNTTVWGLRETGVESGNTNN